MVASFRITARSISRLERFSSNMKNFDKAIMKGASNRKTGLPAIWKNIFQFKVLRIVKRGRPAGPPPWISRVKPNSSYARWKLNNFGRTGGLGILNVHRRRKSKSTMSLHQGLKRARPRITASTRRRVTVTGAFREPHHLEAVMRGPYGGPPRDMISIAAGVTEKNLVKGASKIFHNMDVIPSSIETYVNDRYRRMYTELDSHKWADEYGYKRLVFG